MNRLSELLNLVVERGGSDLHLICGHAPRLRVQGAIHPTAEPELTARELEAICDDLLNDTLRHELTTNGAVDFAHDAGERGRFRMSAYHHEGGLGLACRVVTSTPPELTELGLPPSVADLIMQPRGLVLVTGPTGAGKSTTMASMVRQINAIRKGHIITIEDPIEFVHGYKRSLVTQREVGRHARSFADALRAAVREDPDTILVGEMRDLETIQLALSAAETGIQVLGTLHTAGAARSIDRIVNVFPASRQDQLRGMLAESLRMVVSQILLKKENAEERVLAAEVMITNPAIANMIRTGKSLHINSAIKSGSQYGMQSLDNELKRLLAEGAITWEQAHRHAIDKTTFTRDDFRRSA